MKKHVLNTHIAIDEHEFLKKQSRHRGMTVTGVVREIIRAEMQRIPPTPAEDRSHWASIKEWQDRVDREMRALRGETMPKDVQKLLGMGRKQVLQPSKQTAGGSDAE